MELRQLKYFAKTAETLNFSEAAKALCITQSTLSQQIRQLEQELNVQLFQRNSHSVALTEAGEELLPHALHTLHAADTCFERIRDLQHLLTGSLNIGVTFTFSPILTETLLSFMKQYPHVKLNIYYKPMAELMEMLQQREVDFVLAFKPSKRYEEIESHVLFDNHLAAIVHEHHPLAKKERISLTDLERYDIALPAQGLQARYAFDDALQQFLTHLNVRIELNEVNILLKLIKQSELVTILSEATTYNEPGVKAILLDIPGNEMEGCVHRLKNAYRKHSAQEFIRMLSESNAIRERIKNWWK
ncbi:MAG: LysR family transcriptional regulator [Bacteroides sp.]|nr:LysR family transcriptional regulator [Bacteroides sp.]MBQ8225787.1 LysR family transcriptional regulator [Bacteroides sp.]